jgi:hypothetical protein
MNNKEEGRRHPVADRNPYSKVGDSFELFGSAWSSRVES